MDLSLDTVTLGVPEVQEAKVFYASVFAPTVADRHEYVHLNMHGAGQVAFYGIEALAADAAAQPATSGFRGHTLSYVVSQPSEVNDLLERAAQCGATVLKAAKKSMWGGFSAVFQAPDEAIWKLVAATKKGTGPAADPPAPTETAILLGVADPKISKGFYTALGMSVDKDYGRKYVDFHSPDGASRLGLYTRQALAKDAGVDPDGSGFRAAILNRIANDRNEVDAIISAADAAGGRVVKPAATAEWGGYSGHFADPDGFLWKVACP